MIASSFKTPSRHALAHGTSMQEPDAALSSGHVRMSRWRGRDECRVLAPNPALRVVVLLQAARVSILVGQAALHDGAIATPSVFVAGAYTQSQLAFDGECDCLELEADAAFVAACACNQRPAPPASGRVILVRDEAIGFLARSLLLACGSGCVLDCLERASAPIVSRALALLDREPDMAAPRVALPRWRLQRVDDYIDAHLHAPIRTPDLAAAAGLSSGHFATTFRAATGSSPHAYVMQRRIERACRQLLATRAPIQRIARDTGFRTHAHFTTAFKRSTGQTPLAWRQQRSVSGGAPGPTPYDVTR